MHYSDELDEILKDELNILIEMKKNNQGPFNKEMINEYYAKYKEITGLQRFVVFFNKKDLQREKKSIILEQV